MVPYGLSTLFYGLLSDRIGRRRVIYLSLASFTMLTFLTASARSAPQNLFWRTLTGLGASGVVPMALASIGSLFPPDRRGRPLGWLFGAMAGGMAFGSSLGVMLMPYVGWRVLFIGVANSSSVMVAAVSWREATGPIASIPSVPSMNPKHSRRRSF